MLKISRCDWNPKSRNRIHSRCERRNKSLSSEHHPHNPNRIEARRKGLYPLEGPTRNRPRYALAHDCIRYYCGQDGSRCFHWMNGLTNMEHKSNFVPLRQHFSSTPILSNPKTEVWSWFGDIDIQKPPLRQIFEAPKFIPHVYWCRQWSFDSLFSCLAPDGPLAILAFCWSIGVAS